MILPSPAIYICFHFTIVLHYASQICEMFNLVSCLVTNTYWWEHYGFSNDHDFHLFTVQPQPYITSFSFRVVMFCKSVLVLTRRVVSLAKSRSIRHAPPFHPMPQVWSSITFFMVKSIVRMNKNVERMHPCLAPVYISK